MEDRSKEKPTSDNLEYRSKEKSSLDNMVDRSKDPDNVEYSTQFFNFTPRSFVDSSSYKGRNINIYKNLNLLKLLQFTTYFLSMYRMA